MRHDNDTPHDPITGELPEDAAGIAPRERSASRRGPFGRPKRTPEEEAAAQRVREERAEARRREVDALRMVDPACETADDPPVTWRPSPRIAGEPSGRIFDRARLSGRGKPGSRLIAAGRYYDGCGPNGGEAHHCVTVHVVFADRTGHLRRTVGVAIHRAELRDLAAALVTHADALDAAGAAGAP